ncbi:MAG: class I SAM-dependent methyltransferase [Anaerolineaceae bacterium]|nr:class I SAM-dependent methyltransferase [Anaerolineaceae bacterium]
MTMEDLDWNAVWIERQRRNSQSGRGGGCSQTWMSEEAANKYWRRMMTGYGAQERLQDMLESVRSDFRVLDIGAGPGNFTIPIAQKVKKVTVVEPADGMVSVLQNNIRNAGLNNIDIVHKKWDDVDSEIDLCPPYQFCFASYSLGMSNLYESIKKMLSATRGVILIYWHAGDQPYDKEAAYLWPLLHQKVFYPIPKSNVVFNVLYQMGIYPHVEPIFSTNTVSFSSFEEAMKEYHRRYDVQTAEQENRLSDYLGTRLERQNGGYVITNQHYGMKIWWRNGEERQ